MLAQRVEFAGKSNRLRRILIQAGYLDEQSAIIGWRESLFRLFSAIREQNRERGLRSAAVRSQRPTQPNQTEEERERTTTVQRSVERSVDTPSLPLALASDAIARIAAKCSCTPDGVVEGYELFRGNKLRFGEHVTDLEAELIGFLRTGKEGKAILARHAVRVEKASDHEAPAIPEPAGDWGKAIAGDEMLGDLAGRTWAGIPQEYQRRIANLVDKEGGFRPAYKKGLAVT